MRQNSACPVVSQQLNDETTRQIMGIDQAVKQKKHTYLARIFFTSRV